MTISQLFAILSARRKLAIVVALVTIGLIVGVSLILPKKYLAEASVVIDVKPDPLANIVYGTSVDPGIMATQVDILTSDRVVRRVIKNLKLDQDPKIREQWRDATDGEGTVEDWLGTALSRDLDVKPSRESNVLTVTYKATDPRFAAGMVNAFVQAYMDTTLELRVDPAKQYTAFFEKRTREARQVLATAQNKLSAYQQANGIVSDDEHVDVETAKLNELALQLVSLQSLSADSTSRQAQVAGGKAEQMPDTLNNPVIGNLKFELSRSEAHLQELSNRYGDKHPQVLEAKANADELRARLDAEMKRVTGSFGVTANANRARESEIRAQLDAQRAKLLKLKEVRDASAVLERDVENAQKSYDAIVSRFDQTSLESQTQQSNVNLLSPATPPTTPASPKLLLNSVIAVFLGTLLGIGATLIREMWDRRVRSGRDVTDTLGLPILGVLPRPVNVKKSQPSLMAMRIISGRLSGPKAE